eukprot:tig00021017_g17179.t1
MLGLSIASIARLPSDRDAAASSMLTPSRRRGVTVRDVAPADFIAAYAAHLKRTGKLEVPKWVDLVKTGVHKELAPYDADWYYIRAASMARKIYLRGGQGVGKFKRTYGGVKRGRSVLPAHFQYASGSILRNILKGLEKIKVLSKDPKGGRKITADGQRDLDRIAGQVSTGKQ